MPSSDPLDQAAAWVTEPKRSFDLSKVLFRQQLPFGQDNSRYQTAVTPRRAGKTFAIAAKLIAVAKAKQGCVALYITLSRIQAKRNVWEQLKAINRDWKLGGDVKEGELCIVFGESRVFLSGAADRTEVDKFRGLPLGIVIIDEAQSFPAYLEQLVDEVLAPALTDYSGTLALVGTPGPVPIGYFHDKATSPEWTHHNWSVFDNPHLERKSGRPTRELLADELKRRGVTESDPVIQREWFGRWVLDENSLVFRWDSTRNGRETRRRDMHVLGIDLGFDDADALALLGWDKHSQEVELVAEWVGAKQNISALMARVKAMYDEYRPDAVVADTGGLGKKIAEEIANRTGIPIEAADKQRKNEHIELLNDALRTSRFFAPAESRFAQDCMLVEWDKSNPEKPKISERFHSDICFVAGTLVATRRGEIPIEQVTCGEAVATRAGWRRVTCTVSTPIAGVVTRRIGGRTLVGTPDHPVWTENRGWASLASVGDSDTVLYLCRDQGLRWFSGTAAHGGDGQTARDEVVGSTFKVTRSIFTGLFGRRLTGAFRTAITSITEMVTLATTALRTWSACLAQSTCLSTQSSVTQTQGFGPKLMLDLKRRESLRPSGTDRQKVLPGTPRTPRPHGRSANRSPTDALCVAIGLRLSRLWRMFARVSVSRSSVATLESTTSNLNAQNAVADSRETSTPSQDVAHSAAQPNTATVFGITVDGEHEFFANGILVSNCDAVLYAYMRALAWLEGPAPEVAPALNTPEWYEWMTKKDRAEIETHFEEVARGNRERRQEMDDEW